MEHPTTTHVFSLALGYARHTLQRDTPISEQVTIKENKYGNNATVNGIFEERAQAEQAVTELRNAGFRNDQIEFAGHGAATDGGLLASLKSLFTGEDTTTDHVYEDLVGIGMPTEDARYYQQEY